MHLVEGVVTGLTWPSVELQAASDTDGNDVLLLVGAEPDHAWRAFTNAVVDLALDLKRALVVGLGAYPAPVPHTRPTRLAVTASDPSLATNNLVRGDASTSLPACRPPSNAAPDEVGLAAVGLWAQVPHYLAAMPYPAASVALLDGLAASPGSSRQRLAARAKPTPLASVSTGWSTRTTSTSRWCSSSKRPWTRSRSRPTPRSVSVPSRPGTSWPRELEQFLRDQNP